jgi:hypothetical protein
MREEREREREREIKADRGGILREKSSLKGSWTGM